VVQVLGTDTHVTVRLSKRRTDRGKAHERRTDHPVTPERGFARR
jgi:hypothetical protein